MLAVDSPRLAHPSFIPMQRPSLLRIPSTADGMGLTLESPAFLPMNMLSPPAAHGDVLGLFGAGGYGSGKVNTGERDEAGGPAADGAARFGSGGAAGDGEPDELAAPGGRGDGYEWRKYGQKSTPGVAAPRSYYKCSVAGCGAKKQVERDGSGAVTAVRYEGAHRHGGEAERGGGGADGAGALAAAGEAAEAAPARKRASGQRKRKPPASASSGGSGEADGDEEGGSEGDAPPKRRRRRAAAAAGAALAAAFAEGDDIGDGGDGGGGHGGGHGDGATVVSVPAPDDLLDDGWRWRKYGQKFVRGSTHPRSYYKCTTPGCPMRKHVERDGRDTRLVVSTYEGAHNHARPAVVAARANAPPRPTSAALRAAAAACSVRGGAGAPPPPLPPPLQPFRAALPLPAGGQAGRAAFRPPPRLTIPVAGDELEIPGPMTALGRMPLSAVLGGVDADMMAASLTLLDSAKGTGNRPFSARFGDGLSGLGLTPTPGAAMDAMAGFLDLNTPMAAGGAAGGAAQGAGAAPSLLGGWRGGA